MEAQGRVDKEEILNALGSSSNSEIISNFLNLSLDSDKLLEMNVEPNSFMRAVTDGSDNGVDEILDFIHSNFIALLIKQ